jgi:hypothetical protein
MQVFLSEINCLSILNKFGVYPDEFYTDFDSFRNNMSFFQDAQIIVILAGNCRFNKKLILETVKGLMKRAENSYDVGVKAIYVVSDMTLSGLTSYYKYEGNLTYVSVMHGWKEDKTNAYIWKALSSPKKQTKMYLAKQDTGDISEALERYKNRGRAEDEYISLIKIPTLKKILAQS